MKKGDCLFCELYNVKGEMFFENDFFYSRFDKFPITPGHTEVIPKRHVADLSDLTEEEWTAFKPAIEETIKYIEAKDLRALYEGFIKNPVNEKSVWFCKQMLTHVGIDKKPDAYNHGLNDGEAAGRTIHHLHWHIITRFDGDVEDPRGGIRHMIPGMGNYKV